MQSNLDAAIRLILRSEGGFADQTSLGDRGGPTNYGVTLRTLAACRGAATVGDLLKLTPEAASAIYAAQYAAPVAFDRLPSGLDYCVLDCSVNSGPARAMKLLQRVLGVQQDGVFGMHTMDALGRRPVRGLIAAYCQARLAFMRTLRNWGSFGNGWASRVDTVRSQALAMAAGELPSMEDASLLAFEVDAHPKAAGPVKLSATRSGRAAIATLLATTAAAGSAASEATGLLSGFADVAFLRWVLVGLAVVSAFGTFAVAAQRMSAGATT